MPTLQLKLIQCHGTEDWTGPDESYLLIGGRKVWGSQSMNDGAQEPLTQVSGVPFENSLRLSLYDQDSGLWDDDDYLGSWVVWGGEHTQGEKEARFNGDGADF
ncbi:hypothetical protein [Arthrobacter sp. SO3]|uniref:hypothetical protein n=1 Tax=Arthrobacter sp. SO3 TaxID=1897057 RepID=UPI001CFFA333|nr:hypothetical protein [Arthrobacter sp. SO3]MCB5292362.1 hypothetical protein [Arthrobacter sp. SO3]